ncbi:MAG: heat-inducible transcriptional repressor HrcA [Acidimicrobiales bacterium]
MSEGSVVKDELDDRKAAILRSVVTGYVETAQPVGSSQVARDASIDVSSATIRADMAALERDGYLSHPHTSAGRVPTDKGYRFYVDHLSAPLRLGETKQEQVQEFFSRAHNEIEQMLSDTSRLLVELTDCAAVVVSPDHEKLVIRSALLTRLSARTALLIIVLSNGAVDKQAISVSEESLDEDIEAASNVIHQQLAGQALGHIDLSGGDLAANGRSGIGQLLEECHHALDRRTQPESASDQVYVGGTSRMAERFQAVQQVQAVLSILEQSFIVVGILREVLAQGHSVSIGTENRLQPLSECSLVAAPFESDGEGIGTVAILGPTRMDYPQALAAVALVGQRLSRQLQLG